MNKMVLTKSDILQIKEALSDQITDHFKAPENMKTFAESFSESIKQSESFAETFSEIVKKSTEETFNSKFDEFNTKLNDFKVTNEEGLQKLEEFFKVEIEGVSKSHITLVNEVRDNLIKFENESEKLQGKFHVLENCDIETNKKLFEANNTISVLSQKIIALEKTVSYNENHNRRWNIEIDGIPSNIGDDRAQLEEAVLEILEAINVDCESDDIQACHRLPAKTGVKPTIVRFGNRKTVDDINKNKHKLRDLSSLNINVNGLTETSNIYINASLCKYYKCLQYNCRVLKRHGIIKENKTSDDGVLKIVTLANEHIKIAHESDLVNRFAGFKHFSFDNSF